jgi:HAD superfamily hydrolase (TIGR01458 family)
VSDDKAPVNSLLIDLDGVVYQGNRIIDGAVDTLKWLRVEQIPHLFVTNTTSCSRRALLEKIQGLGLDANEDEIVTPIIACKQWLVSQNYRRAALYVTQAALEDFSGIDSIPYSEDSTVDAVVIGDLGEAWDYETLNSAFRLLMRQPAPVLIALGMTRYWRAEDGLRLDVAPFVKALEYAANGEARVFGKPAGAFFESALAILGCPAGQALILGDDIVGDIDAAQRCGIRGLQVKTGKFRDADLTGDIQPFAMLESIASLPYWWSATFG